MFIVHQSISLSLYFKRDLFKRAHLMLIKQKLVVNTLILFISMILMLLITNYVSSTHMSIEQATGYIGDIRSNVLQLRRHEKDFLMRKDIKYKGKFNQTTSKLLSTIDNLDKTFNTLGIDVAELSKLRKISSKYKKDFNSLVTMQELIGLDSSSGLYGDLRKSIHALEAMFGRDHPLLLSDILQLRRDEKDFMLRLDKKYVQRLATNIDVMATDIRNSDLTTTKQQSATQLLFTYHKAFKNLVSQQIALGLDQNSGALSRMRTSVHKVDDVLKRLLVISDKAIVDHSTFANTVSYSIFTVLLAIGIVFSIMLGRSILNPIENMRRVMNTVAENNDLTIEV